MTMHKWAAQIWRTIGKQTNNQLFYLHSAEVLGRRNIEFPTCTNPNLSSNGRTTLQSGKRARKMEQIIITSAGQFFNLALFQ